MSSLTSIDKKLLEDALDMSGGHVLDLTRKTLCQTVEEATSCDIYTDFYAFNGDSKAKRLRAFWEIENDEVTAQGLKHLLDYTEAFNLAEPEKVSKCRNIVNRLTGAKSPPTAAAPTKEAFLSQEFQHIDFQKLPIEGALIPILEQRWEEAKRCANSEAYLSTVILLGSMLEAILLGVATQNPKEYNQATSAPKKDGKAKPFYAWSLANLIDTARELGFINENVKKFSHALRDFRNYVHPYEQKLSQFTPDKDTANISLQVFRAAMNQITNSK